MKQILLFLVSSLYLQTAFAGNEMVVRIRSGACDGDRSRFLASGLLLRNADKLYVQTAAHAIVNGHRPAFCHEVEHPLFGRVPAELVAAEAGLDLALLRIHGAKGSSNIPAFDALPAQSLLQRNDRVIVTGYPQGSDTAVLDNHGYVLQLHSSVPALALRRDVLEIAGAYGSPGMSGAPVLAANGIVVGILSHQYFQSRRPSLLAIPMSQVTRFLNRYFRDPAAFQPVLSLDPEAQWRGANRWLGGGLVFDFAAPVGTAALAMATLGKPDGIGGGKDRAEGWTVTIRFGEPTNHALEEVRREWMIALRSRLAVADAFAEVPYFIRRQSGGLGFPIRENFHSAAEFFRDLADENLLPITHLHSRTLQTETSVSILLARGTILEELATDLRNHSLGTQDRPELDKAREFLDHVDIIATLLRDDWRMLRPSDVQHCLDDNAAWRDLFSADLETTKKLFSELREILNALEKLGVKA